MQIVYLGLSLAGLAIGATRYLRIPAWYAPFFTLCCLIGLLYTAAIAGQLYPVAVALYVGGFAALAHFLPRLDYREIDAGSAIFCGALLLVIAFFYGRLGDGFQFVGWDEFSHWALSVKNLLGDHRLWNEASNIQFKAYAPGTAMLQYYFALFNGGSESAQLIGINVFIASAIIAIVGPAIRMPILAAVFAGLSIFATYVFGYSFYDIYVDHTLGFVFAAALSFAMFSKRSWKDVLLLFPALVVLILIKHVGLIFAAVVAASALAIHLWSHRHVLLPLKVSRLVWIVAPDLVLLVAIAFATFSWRYYLAKIGVVASYSESMTPGAILRFFFAPDELSRAVVAEFSNRFFNGQHATIWLQGLMAYATAIPYAKILLALSAIAVLVAALVLRSGIVIGLVALVAGAVGYLLVLLLSYRYYFGEYEARILVSFERYYGTYLLAMALVLLGVLCRYLAELSAVGRAFAATAFALIFFAAPIGLRNTVLFEPNLRSGEVAASMVMRAELQQIADDLLPNTDMSSAVYYVSQDDTGYSYYLFRYLIAPLRTNTWCWTLGKPYRAEDIWTCDLDFVAEMRGYTYIVTYNADQAFWEQFGSFFDPADRGSKVGIYRIVHAADGSVVFEKIGAD